MLAKVLGENFAKARSKTLMPGWLPDLEKFGIELFTKINLAGFGFFSGALVL